MMVIYIYYIRLKTHLDKIYVKRKGDYNFYSFLFEFCWSAISVPINFIIKDT